MEGESHIKKVEIPNGGGKNHEMTVNTLYPGWEILLKDPKERTQEEWQDLILKDVLERPGQHSFEDSRALLGESLAAMRRIEKKTPEGSISRAENVNDIETGGRKNLKEGGVSYTATEDDATIINASDAHGSFKDLKIAIADFIERMQKGENVYFNFSGDVSSGDTDEVIPCLEALSSLRMKYPERVSTQFGNGDRRGASLVLGGAKEAVSRFSPQLDEFLRSKFAEENAGKPEQEGKKKGMEEKAFYGMELLKIARLSGSQALDPQTFNSQYLEQVMRGLKLGNVSLNEIKHIATDTMKGSRETYPQDIQAEAVKVFEYWKLMDQVLNDQPAITIYRTGNKIVLAIHAGFTDFHEGRIGNLCNNPQNQDKAAWDKLIHNEKEKGGIEKYGPYISFPPEDQAKFIEAVLPERQ